MKHKKTDTLSQVEVNILKQVDIKNFLKSKIQNWDEQKTPEDEKLILIKLRKEFEEKQNHLQNRYLIKWKVLKKYKFNWKYNRGIRKWKYNSQDNNNKKWKVKLLKEKVIDLEDRQRRLKLSIIRVSEKLKQHNETELISETIIQENCLENKWSTLTYWKGLPYTWESWPRTVNTES